MSRHTSPKDVIKKKTIELTKRGLKKNKLLRIYGKAKIGKLNNTYVGFSSSVMNLNVPIAIQDILNLLNVRKGCQTHFAIICNYVGKQL